MKRITFALAAVLPFAVMAGDAGNSQKIKVDAEKLRRATPASVLLNEDIVTNDGREAGSVEDIIVSRDGKVRHFLVDVEQDALREQRTAAGGQEGQQGQESQREPVYETRGAEAGQTRSGAQWTGGDGQLAQLDPGSIKYDTNSKKATVDENKLKSTSRVSEDRTAQSRDELKVSELIGMEIQLRNEDSFGSVEDVMLSEDNTEVVALAVDNWDGFDKQRRALPLEGVQIDAEAGEIRYEYSLSDVEALPEFNLERYTEEGWDMTDW